MLENVKMKRRKYLEKYKLHKKEVDRSTEMC